MNEIRIRKAPGLWVVRSDGAVLAETRNALELDEAGRAPVIFFPEADVAMALLDRGTSTPSAHGEVIHFALSSTSGMVANVAWGYDAPADPMGPLSGHLAFDGIKVAVERL